MTNAALNLWHALVLFAIEAAREPWAAVAVGAFVLGLLLDRSRLGQATLVGRAAVGAFLAYWIARLIQEVIR